VIALMIALGVAVVAAYVKFEGFRKVVHAVINFVIQIVEDWVNAFIKGINIIIMAINGFKRIINFFGGDMETIGHIGAVSFGRIGDAATSAAAAVYSTAQMIRMAEKTAIKPAASATDDLADLMKKLKLETGSGSAKAVETAKEKLQKYVDALKGMSSAQKSARDADKSLMKSRTSLAEATTKLTDAQAYFNQVDCWLWC
jgi:hypothetical protein